MFELVTWRFRDFLNCDRKAPGMLIFDLSAKAKDKVFFRFHIFTRVALAVALL